MNTTYLPNLETYKETCKISKTEQFPKIFNGLLPLTIQKNCPILDVWQLSEYASTIFPLTYAMLQTFFKEGFKEAFKGFFKAFFK